VDGLDPHPDLARRELHVDHEGSLSQTQLPDDLAVDPDDHASRPPRRPTLDHPV
jgi:hypothetical protein